LRFKAPKASGSQEPVPGVKGLAGSLGSLWKRSRVLNSIHAICDIRVEFKVQVQVRVRIHIHIHIDAYTQ